MPAHKNKNRGNHAPQPQPSDYETDAPPNITVPRPPQRTNEEVNFTVLSRKFPSVASIVHVTSHTVLYTFNLETQQWEKNGIEGSMFLCELKPSLAGAGRFAAIIMNRRALENWFMEIRSPDEIEFTDEYIIIQADQVYGIWIFSEPNGSTANARIETAEKLHECAIQVQEARNRETQDEEGQGKEDEEVPAAVPMGRQLSLRELFGQQREQDAGWSVHDHHSHSDAQYASTPSFVPTPSPRPAPAQNDVLGQLFKKAKQDYNGLG